MLKKNNKIKCWKQKTFLNNLGPFRIAYFPDSERTQIVRNIIKLKTTFGENKNNIYFDDKVYLYFGN